MKRLALTLASLTLCASAFAQQVTIHSPWVRGTVPEQKATGTESRQAAFLNETLRDRPHQHLRAI